MMENHTPLIDIVRQMAAELPHFPDGRIDYSTAQTAPVVIVFVRWNGKLLLLKRSEKVRAYRGKWSTVAGYLDEVKSIEEKVREELREEVGITDENIATVTLGEWYTFDDADLGVTWIRQPVIVDLQRKPAIRLNWEHTELRWIDPDDLPHYETELRLDLTWDYAQKHQPVSPSSNDHE